MVRSSCVSHDRCFLKPCWQSFVLFTVGYDAAVDDVIVLDCIKVSSSSL